MGSQEVTLHFTAQFQLTREIDSGKQEKKLPQGAHRPELPGALPGTQSGGTSELRVGPLDGKTN